MSIGIEDIRDIIGDIERAFKKAQWMSMEAAYLADGPDGSDLGYSRDGLLCVLCGACRAGDPCRME